MYWVLKEMAQGENLKNPTMKNVLIISFDLIRKGEVTQSLSIASLLTYLKSDHRYGEEFTVYHLPFNMFNIKNKIFPHYFTVFMNH